MDTSNTHSSRPDPPTADELAATIRYVLGNVDDARRDLDRAQAALATATAYGRLTLGRFNDNAGDEES